MINTYMRLQELLEGKVSDAYTNGTYFAAPPPTQKIQMTHGVFIRGRLWKEFPSEKDAMRAGNSVYQKNPRIRVDIKPL